MSTCWIWNRFPLMCLFFPSKKNMWFKEIKYMAYMPYISQTWKVKVGIRWMLERYNQFIFLHSQINLGVLMLEFCPLPLFFLPSNFALCFDLFHICTIFCPFFALYKKEGKGKDKKWGENIGQMWCWCDDFGVKYDQKESHNMILMSK